MRDRRGGALAVAVLLAVLTGCGGGVTGEPPGLDAAGDTVPFARCHGNAVPR